jgi:unsaturated chondroitin disaccharide hydrolase
MNMRKPNFPLENLRRETLFAAPPPVDRSFWQKAFDFAKGKIQSNIAAFGSAYPAPASKDGVYPLIENVDWTASFWPGMLWLAWEATGDAVFQKAAKACIPDFHARLDKRIATDTHDLGFLYTLACVAPWRLTGNTAGLAAALKAADLLMERFYEKAGVIQAWGDLNDRAQRGRIIIDCAMNLPLLFWAAEENGNLSYRLAALRHIENANRCLIRNDWSTWHTFFFDTETGEALRGKTAQGYSDDSCWARGQTWGIYGNALCYRYLGDVTLLEYSRGLARYFLNRLPDDLVAYWDLCFTEGGEERDSSAAAIAVCGLLELSRCLPPADPDHRLFENAALRIAASLAQSYTTVNEPASTGILLHGVYSKPDGNGVDECTTFGDYFYTEALVRILTNWKPYW